MDDAQGSPDDDPSGDPTSEPTDPTGPTEPTDPTGELAARWAAALAELRQRPGARPVDPVDPVAPATAGSDDPARAAWRELAARWQEPHRRYHDLAHLTQVLARIDDLAAEPHDGPVVVLAAYLHDAVYDPLSATNEADSAALASEVLDGLGVPAEAVDRVARLVLATATHAPDGDDRDLAVLCDADLAVLAGGPDAYAAYAAAVREEYAMVPDDRFRAGRTDVLMGLLALPSLFATPTGRRRWEAAARHNVATELELLSLGGPAPRPSGRPGRGDDPGQAYAEGAAAGADHPPAAG